MLISKARQSSATVAAKNIVICSDGTGNRGGKGNGTNVWRLYNAVNLRSSAREQITHYDDGVGTDDNKYLRAFGGAVGWGFSNNVKRAYRFLTNTWNDGDHIYMFGFSRGAYTVRALAAFVAKCGVIEGIRGKTLGDAIDKLVNDYHEKRIDENYDAMPITGPIDIQFVGVWDTVSAIGLPFDILLKQLIVNSRLFPFKFKDHSLSEHVKRGWHALALDDERRTFHPVMWKARPGIEQVWFSGVHSNVGGGYPKQEVEHVALEWMISGCKWNGTQGIEFDEGFETEVSQNANVHGKLYDSRSGVAAYYRYAPRNVGLLCRQSKIDKAKIHASVFDRIELETHGYNPGTIPAKIPIEVVGNDDSKVAEHQQRIDRSQEKRSKILDKAVPWIDKRKALHLVFVLFTLLSATAVAQFLISRPDSAPASGSSGWLTFLPIAFSGFAISVTMIYLKRIGRKALCLSALIILGACIYTPVGEPLAVWRIGENLSSVIEFLLPDLLETVVIYFLDNYTVHLLTVIVAFIVMLVLRSRYRDKCNVIFEEACDELRSRSSSQTDFCRRLEQ